jgi:hypothetical protein
MNSLNDVSIAKSFLVVEREVVMMFISAVPTREPCRQKKLALQMIYFEED